jgi:hypothetical protein
VRFVDAVGCCAELPGFPDFPYLAPVMGHLKAGVPDPWFWKDDLHIEKRLYYTYVFGGRPGFVSNALLPAFIASNGAAADELLLYGALTPEARQIYHLIEEQGPIPIRTLKRLLTPDAKHRANTELHNLERLFIITKSGITGRTLGSYGYIWELLERWAPEMLVAADRLGRTRGKALIRAHLESYGIAHDSPFYRKVLGWGE